MVEASVLAIVQYDPFKKAKVFLKLELKRDEQVVKHRNNFLNIDAIFNKKVYINSKFYGVGQTIYGYKIVSIAKKYIKVKKNRKISIIPLIKSNYFANIKIKGEL